MKRTSIWVLAIGLSTAAVALARPGVVTRQDGSIVRGEVKEENAQYVVQAQGGVIVTVPRDDVRDVLYAESNQDEFDLRLKELDPGDSKGRLKLAQWALERKEYDLAMDALDEAARIGPRTAELADLRVAVQQHRRLSWIGREQYAMAAPVAAQRPAAAPARPAAAAPAPATQPTTRPATRPVVQVRLVTPGEINRVRQMEWRENDNTVRVKIDQNLRRRYLENTTIPPAEFNRLTPPQQARAMIKDGSEALREQVVLASDPAPLAAFRKQVQRVVLPGCATANCHGSPDNSNFRLFSPADQDAQAYTNFLILQNYEVKTKGGNLPVINHTRPEDSLLLQYGLSRDVARFPHPKTQGLTPFFRGMNDARYKEVLNWLSQSLTPVKPDYGIDLTKPPEGAAAAADR